MIQGITVTLFERHYGGEDPFGAPIEMETPLEVDDVLVYPASATDSDVIDALNLYGKKAVYTIAIPKGDTHRWEDNRVQFFGQTFRVFGKPIQGIEANIPLRWNKKVMVEMYE